MKALLAKIWRTLRLPKNLQLIIMRLFQDQFLIGVTGVIFNEKNEVLLFKHSYRQTQWSLPGGYIKTKEHPREGLEREILEESGFIVSVDKELFVKTDRESARLDISLSGIYIGGEFKPSAEVTEFGFFSFENLPLISKNQLLLIEQTLRQHPISPPKTEVKKKRDIFQWFHR
jgi:8-oxo-dGTP diphosphatase